MGINKNSNLINQLVDKSIEAFIMGLEIYNKPTIKYRIEGFSFFICNAWELMLKAELLRRDMSIYYKDSSYRTLNLENCIKLIYTNDKGYLRKNLETIIELRNISTHFITQEYELIYAPLFQACVQNYSEQLSKFHKKNISDYISQGFLVLSPYISDLNESNLRAKYSPQVLEKLFLQKEKIDEISENSNPNFRIEIKPNFYITKNSDTADVHVAINKDSNAKATLIREIKDPSNLFPYKNNDVIKVVNKKLKIDNILLTKIYKDEEIEKPFSSYDFQLFIKFYNIKNNTDYSYYHKLVNTYSYSQSLVDFIIKEIKKRPKTIISELKKGIESNKKR